MTEHDEQDYLTTESMDEQDALRSARVFAGATTATFYWDCERCALLPAGTKSLMHAQLYAGLHNAQHHQH